MVFWLVSVTHYLVIGYLVMWQNLNCNVGTCNNECMLIPLCFKDVKHSFIEQIRFVHRSTWDGVKRI